MFINFQFSRVVSSRLIPKISGIDFILIPIPTDWTQILSFTYAEQTPMGKFLWLVKIEMF